MAMLAIETERMLSVRQSAVIRQIDIFAPPKDEMDDFMATFDQEVTVDASGWDKWSKRNNVDQRAVESENFLMMAFLGLSPWLTPADNRAELIESTHEVQSHLHEGEQEYIDFLLFFLLNH